MTEHSIHIAAAQNMRFTDDDSVNLIVTSPPYPMIEMWDEVFGAQNSDITANLSDNPDFAFELMHQELDKVWKECFRTLKDGGFLCVNIGDATRTINGKFQLFNNHGRIMNACAELGFTNLPDIVWHKCTNAPNKFMGSGMLPCGAYVTLEHEHILIFRKGGKRPYDTDEDKKNRAESAYFFEERNQWFSDIWNIHGLRQNCRTVSRGRTAAYPLEIPYRLINMFSEKNDIVLDPFAGTGTTATAAIILERNSQNYEIDSEFENVIRNNIETTPPHLCNKLIKNRLNEHIAYINDRISSGKKIKYYNKNINCQVITKQEEHIRFNAVKEIRKRSDGKYNVIYE